MGLQKWNSNSALRFVHGYKQKEKKNTARQMIFFYWVKKKKPSMSSCLFFPIENALTLLKGGREELTETLT